MARGEHWIPSRGSEGAAGWDLYAAEDTILDPYKPTLVPTNIDIAIPKDYMLLVLPRSGNSLKKNFIIPNSPGLIDEDYRGHLMVLLTYIPHPDKLHPFPELVKVAKGDRIAQAVLVKYEPQIWVRQLSLPPTSRGTGGFGSTGS